MLGNRIEGLRERRGHSLPGEPARPHFPRWHLPLVWSGLSCLRPPGGFHRVHELSHRAAVGPQHAGRSPSPPPCEARSRGDAPNRKVNQPASEMEVGLVVATATTIPAQLAAGALESWKIDGIFVQSLCSRPDRNWSECLSLQSSSSIQMRPTDRASTAKNPVSKVALVSGFHEDIRESRPSNLAFVKNRASAPNADSRHSTC